MASTPTELASAILATRPAPSIEAVVEMMTALDACLPENDGLRWFNRLYLRVTLGVRADVAAPQTFRDVPFMVRLDVEFANLYFNAAAAGIVNPGTAPPAWRPLFEARSLALKPIQFALAGMNAHINRDLPAAVVSTYVAMGGAPSEGDPRHADFVQINDLLERVESEIKTEFAIGVIAVVDVAAGQTDDEVAMWSLRAARDAAWTNSEVLWKLQSVPSLRDRYFQRLDGLAGFAGRGLLVAHPLAHRRTVAARIP